MEILRQRLAKLFTNNAPAEATPAPCCEDAGAASPAVSSSAFVAAADKARGNPVIDAPAAQPRAYFDPARFADTAVNVRDVSPDAPERREARSEMLYQVADLVPFIEGPRRARGKPAADVGRTSPQVIPFAEAIKEEKVGAGDHAVRLWSATDMGELWESDTGRAVAAFGMDRYGKTMTRGGPDKLHHGTEVLFNANQIFAQQSDEKPVLTQNWREFLEFASVLHDIGYFHGGRGHAGTGGHDVMNELPKYLERLGVDTLSREDIEKIGVLIQLHSAAFPWDHCDQRLANSVYVHVDLVQQVMASQRETLKSVLRSENREYLSTGDAGKLSWLDDDAQLTELISAGWILHCADNYNGPAKPPKDPLSQDAVAAKPVLGQSQPVRDLPTWSNHFRARDITSVLQGFMQSAVQPLQNLATLAQDPDQLVEVLQRQKVPDAVISQVVSNLDPVIGAELERELAVVGGQLGDLASNIPTLSNEAFGERLTQLASPQWMEDMATAVELAAPTLVELGMFDAEAWKAGVMQTVAASSQNLAGLPEQMSAERA